MERSRGIYKPIRVLFDTPIYGTAVNTCWNLKGYKTQIAIMTEFLRLQQENQVPAHITAEDMSNLLVQESNKTLREQLWEFKLEDLEETEAKPLLKLVWAVNITNKMRDVEFQARMLLRFPEAKPPEFQAPKLLSMVKDFIELLKDKQHNTEISRLHTTEEVVIEVVPRVLQGFWQLPPQPLLNMASQSLSVLCTSVTKATLDKVCKTLTAPEGHANFSRSIRDTMVQTILKEIREQHPPDILLNSISNFAPALLTSIAGVSKKHICELFQPQNPSKLDGVTAASQSPSRIQEGVNITVPVVSPAKAPCLLEVKQSEEPLPEAPSLLEVKQSEEPLPEAPCLLEVKQSEEPLPEAPSLLEVKQSDEPLPEAPSLLEVKQCDEPLPEAPCCLEVKPSEEPLPEAPCLLEVKQCDEPLPEAPSLLEVKPSDEPLPEAPCCLEVKPSDEPLAEAPSLLEVKQCDEPLPEAPSLLEVKQSDEPLPEAPCLLEVKQSDEPLPESPCLLEVKQSDEPLAEAPCLLEVKQCDEPLPEAPCLLEVKQSEEPLPEAPSLLEVKPSDEPLAEAPSLLEVKPSDEPLAEAPSLLEVKPSEEPPTAHLSVSEECVPFTVNCEEIKAKKKKKKKMGFFQKLCRTLCCCVSPSTTD